MESALGQQRIERAASARARRKGVLSRTCACVAIATSPAMSFATVARASAGPMASAATFKGGILALDSSVMAGMQGGSITLPDTHTPTPPPPPDHHPTPPPPPPPDHHPTPPPPPPPDHHPPPPPPPPASGSSFTFYLPWPSGPQEQNEDQDVLDLALEDDALIETGVTSG